MYASVVLEQSVGKTLDYLIPEEMVKDARPGVRVTVPLRMKEAFGFILTIQDSSTVISPKALKAIHPDTFLTEELLQLALWMASYYVASLESIFKTMLPSGVRKETKKKTALAVIKTMSYEELRKLATETKSEAASRLLEVLLLKKGTLFLSAWLEEAKASRSSVDSLIKKGAIELKPLEDCPLKAAEFFRTKPKTLSIDQQNACNFICESIEKNTFTTHLLHGITGSGKTEIYLQAMQKALTEKKSIIFLVPEVSLTTQMVERLKARFEIPITVYHHRLSDGERRDAWQKLESGEHLIVLGPRSAIFAPIRDLGLIIVDEEHETAYKQSDAEPFYNARDVAVMRGKMSHATVILGSATPSLESYHNALTGKYKLATLTSRHLGAELAKVTLIDMRKEYEKKNRIFSDALLSGIIARHQKGEQSLLFLNRRGYHTALFCQSCQTVIKCPDCDISLTFHRSKAELVCHLCGFSMMPPTTCPSCQNPTIKYQGYGTEQVERALKAIFPEIRTLRIDSDTTKHKGSLEKMLREFGTGKADVLIGTQMIAKGLHFPEVTLVAILNSDGPLNIPDFRAAEHTFQMITQVAGRSGRGVSKGEVLIQTSLPDNSTLLHAQKQDYVNFYQEEVALREFFHYPPFTHLFRIGAEGKLEKKVIDFLIHFREELLLKLPKEFEALPISPASYAKVKGFYRFQFIVKGKNVNIFSDIARELKKTALSGVRLQIEIDP